MNIIVNILAIITIVFTAVGIVLSAGLWAIGVFSNNYTQSINGKKGCLITGAAGVVVIIGYLIISIFFVSYPTSNISSDTTTYQSKTDIPGFTLKTTWDTPTVQNRSIFLSCSIQPENASQIKGLFGPGYDFFLTAQLEASTFTIDTKEQLQQPIAQKTISFNWTATPTLTGKQAININITGIWVAQQGGKQIIHYLGNHSWHVNVDPEPTPFFTSGQVNISTLVTALLTSIISIPLWDIIRDIIRKKQLEKKEKGEQSSGQQ